MRIQSPEGTKRISIEKTDSIKSLYEKVHDAFSLSGYRFALYKDKSQKSELVSSRSKTILNYGLQHGDMIYMSPINGAVLWTSEPGPSTSLPSGEPSSSSSNTNYGNLVVFADFEMQMTC